MKKTNVKMQKAERKINRKTKKEQGITLIALVITIVILIILATVTLSVVLGEGGLIDKAQQAKELTEQATLKEQKELNVLMSEYTNIMAESQTPTEEKSEVAEAIENQTKYSNTTPITDDINNIVYIPGGFHLAEDSGTKVEEGIVIEDDLGNQFVWIPTGTYNVSTSINSAGKLTNELSRRNFEESKSVLVNADDMISTIDYVEVAELIEENNKKIQKLSLIERWWSRSRKTNSCAISTRKLWRRI